MTFETIEVSNEDGAASALYTIKWGNTIWRYTSADRDITRTENAVPVTYLAMAISDDGMVQGGSDSNDFTVTMQSDVPLTVLFRSTPPSETIWLTVRRLHEGETDAPIYWIGWIANVKRSVAGESIILICSPITASFKRSGLRLCWSRTCPHVLYDYNCRVDKDDFAVSATVTAKTGNSITVSTIGGHAAPWFSGGFLSWIANGDGTIERRTIERQDGSDLLLFGTTDRLDVAQAVILYPGCDLTAETCEVKFDNLVNGGMDEYMPGKSPFDGTQVF